MIIIVVAIAAVAAAAVAGSLLLKSLNLGKLESLRNVNATMSGHVGSAPATQC